MFNNLIYSFLIFLDSDQIIVHVVCIFRHMCPEWFDQLFYLFHAGACAFCVFVLNTINLTKRHVGHCH